MLQMGTSRGVAALYERRPFFLKTPAVTGRRYNRASRPAVTDRRYRGE